ncbi:hypothetical protein MUN84_16400 [Hymenobacter sp. 5516J-16]|uniref:hypothetical protein n=1 Tax=Hymenobacter sp. 5516J-16 TaxID=2932253 RepID=UPI001FD13D9A|nr:hypothetical protein [Hymenobacter sp. 5516J-16]UOQ76161.1 hypothetical protein MUN84_16400 [Hymenobacter sp. 5516J-16]
MVLLCGLTNVNSFFYWSGGYTAYTVGIIFAILFITFFYKLKKYDTIQNLIWCCLWLGLATGCYEVIMMIILWITFTNVFYSKILGQGFRSALLLFIFSIGCALFSILAPGNTARASGINSRAAVVSISKLIATGAKSVFFALGSVVSWADSILLLLGTLLLLQLLYKRRGEAGFFNLPIHPVLVLVWIIGGISLSIFPSIFAYQSVWIHTWQCVYFFFSDRVASTG